MGSEYQDIFKLHFELQRGTRICFHVHDKGLLVAVT